MHPADLSPEEQDTTTLLPRRERPVLLFGTMLASALASLVAAWVLSIDAWVLAANPAAQFSCDISTVISCGKVALSPQASIFGFPNSYLGLMCEPVVITIAVAGMAGVRFPRWFMAAAQFVYLLGLAFAYWLFYQSYAVIQAFCPWCLIITVGTTLVFFTLLRYNLRGNNLYMSDGLHARAVRFLEMGGDLIIPLLILLGIALLIIMRYGPYLLP